MHGKVAIMANASGGSIDLASLMRTNKVEALHATASCGPTRFLVWTRLPEDSSTWILKYVSLFILRFLFYAQFSKENLEINKISFFLSLGWIDL